jgi:hypothetical protein
MREEPSLEMLWFIKHKDDGSSPNNIPVAVCNAL